MRLDQHIQPPNFSLAIQSHPILAQRRGRYTGWLMTRLAISLLAVVCLAPVYAEKPFEFWPGTTYDSKVPTVRQVLGYEPGDKVTNHAGLVKYMEALAAAAPSRMKVFEYGESWEGRKLIYAAVGSEANIRKLGEIKSAIQRIADPRKTPEAEARKLIAGLPAVVWLSYGVHGNEISSPDAALLTAYHLLAARNDKIVDDVLVEGGGADRSDAEPRRPRPLRELLRTGARPGAGRRARSPPNTTSRGPAAAPITTCST